MAYDITNQYFRNEVLSASPEKLRLMLLEGCVHFLEQGKAGIESKDWEAAYEGNSQAKDILFELVATMNRDAAPDLCERVSSLYMFLIKEITLAGFEKDPDRLGECIRLMRYEVETWKLLMDKLKSEGPARATSNRAAPSGGYGGGPSTGQPHQGGSFSMSA